MITYFIVLFFLGVFVGTLVGMLALGLARAASKPTPKVLTTKQTSPLSKCGWHFNPEDVYETYPKVDLINKVWIDGELKYVRNHFKDVEVPDRLPEEL
jgi:hypothetical protein